MVLDSKAGPEVDNAQERSELGPWDTGVEVLFDASKDDKALVVSLSEAQKVQFEIVR